MGPWAEQLVIVKQNKTDVYPQPGKNDIYFPSSIDMERINWQVEFVTLKRKKEEWVFIFPFPKNKEENSEQAWTRLYFFYFNFS